MKNLLIASIFFFISTTISFSQFGGGAGTEASPYLITQRSHIIELNDSIFSEPLYPINKY